MKTALATPLLLGALATAAIAVAANAIFAAADIAAIVTVILVAIVGAFVALRLVEVNGRGPRATR